MVDTSQGHPGRGPLVASPALGVPGARIFGPLPAGVSLTDQAWRLRHRTIVALLWLHVPALIVVATLLGHAPLHAIQEATIVAAFAALASWPRLGRRPREIFAALGLSVAAAALVHLTGGVTEAHFHYFIVIAVVALYQSWAPLLAAVGFVLLEHALLGTLAPGLVYSHPLGWSEAAARAAVHSGAVLATAAACVVAWRVTQAEHAARLVERAAAEEALSGSEERFRRAFEDAPIGMALVGLDGRFIRVNPALGAITGYTEEELQALTFQDVTYPDDLNTDLDHMRRLLAGEMPTYQMEKRYVRKDGSVVSTLLAGSVVRDGHGAPHHFVAQVQDISERKAKAEAEEANRIKSAFLSTMSHELRTPMNAVIGYAHLLLDGMSGELTPQQVADVGQIAASGDRLLRLINDVLDLSRIEAGGVELNREPVNLAALVAGVREELAPLAAAKGIVLADEVAPDFQVVADPLRLRQVLLNLAGNAVKFTESGSVTVTVQAVADGMEIAVRDTGIGIPPEALPVVFDEFRQADGSTTRTYGGTGLGLAISKKLIELHGGTIRAESDPGVGSTFTVTIPAV